MLLVYEEDEDSAAAGQQVAQAQNAQTPPKYTPQSVYRECPWWDLISILSGQCNRWGTGNAVNPVSFLTSNNLGHVPYTYEQPSPFGVRASARVQNAMRLAMDDWEQKTNGAVRFREATFWEEVTGGLMGGSGLLRIAEAEISSGGRATVGTNPLSNLVIHSKFGHQYTQTNDQKIEADNKDVLLGLARHELGHVLGLWHEHQRWDRETYLDLSAYPIGDYDDFRLVKEFSTWGFHFIVPVQKRISFSYPRCSFSWRRGLRCSWVTGWTYIIVPEWRYIEFKERNGNGSAQFDCLSVMLYPGIRYRETSENHCLQTNSPATVAWYGQKVNGTLIPYKGTNDNLDISSTDAATIQGRYGK